MIKDPWELEVCARIEYLHQTKARAETARSKALNDQKAIDAEIAETPATEKKKREGLMIQSWETGQKIKKLRYTIKECSDAIDEAIANADQPQLFGKNPKAAIKKPESDEDDDEGGEEPAATPAGKTKQLELKGPRMAQA